MRQARISDLPEIPLRKSLDTILSEARQREVATVFLSHSHLDTALLGSVVELLRAHGATAYVDEADDSISDASPRDVANRLRKRMDGCKRLVAVGTQNLSSSRWIPWELGYFDARKGVMQVALLPLDISAVQTASLEQEYLKTYPTILRHPVRQLGYREEWVVMDPRDRNYWLLAEWLNGGPG